MRIELKYVSEPTLNTILSFFYTAMGLWFCFFIFVICVGVFCLCIRASSVICKQTVESTRK
jgi:hypothetical protein